MRIKSRSPREVLNEIKWKGFDMGRCEICYVHRGAPGNVRIVKGNEVEVGRGFFRLGDSMIPYHRVVWISYDGERIWERSKVGR